MTPYELEKRADGSITERKSYVPEIATFGATAIAALAIAFYSAVSFGGGGIAGGPAPQGIQGPPNAPVIQNVFSVVDSVTFRVSLSAFAGSQGDTHDSTWIIADTAGGDFTSPLLSVKSGPQTIDTISYSWSDGAVTDIVALYKGVNGGWSAQSGVWQRTISWVPGQINNLAVVSVTDSSATLEWTSVHDGHGSVNLTNILWDINPPIAWWEHGTVGVDSDSITGTAIGASTQYTIQGLTSALPFEAVAVSYRGVLNVDAVFGSVSNVASGTTSGGGPPSTNPPNQPTLNSMLATATITNIQLNGSGYVGDGTHAKSQWQVDNDSDLSSPIYNDSATTGISHLASSGSFLQDVRYYGRVRHRNEYGWSSWSGINSVVNVAPPPPGTCTGGSHEPGDFTQITCQEFSVLPTTPWWLYNPNGYMTIFNDVTAPTGGDYLVDRILYPQGSTSDVYGGGTTGTYLDHANVYVALYHKFSANWQWHPSGANKTWRMIDLSSAGSGGSTPFVFQGTFNGQSVGGTYEYVGDVVDTYGPTDSAPNRRFDNNLTPVRVTAGNWAFIEMIFRHQLTPGGADGEFHMWVNGTKTTEYFDVDWMPSDSNRRWSDTKWDPIWGGTGGIAAEDMYQYTDRYYVSGSN